MVDINERCRNIVDMTAGRTSYVVLLMKVVNEREKHQFWLQAMGLIETWFLI